MLQVLEVAGAKNPKSSTNAEGELKDAVDVMLLRR